MSLHFYLAIGAILFVLGIVCMVTRRNAIALLMGVELVLNSANLNFVAFSRFTQAKPIEGQVMSIFVIILAAAEAVVALAIVMNLYRQQRSIQVDEAHELQG
ncbi:MAG: NADH-quinone oxidoreductase subunit NuoK [bacterium]|jgi:NADH-quinone oxidoreductase subunit K|nr:NADH-quinone oxidoreductase subunit NuoK [bacterium]